MSIDYMAIAQSVGQVLGIPAVVGVCYLVFTIKSLIARVDKLERDSDLLKGTLGEMNASLSYIKGKLEASGGRK